MSITQTLNQAITIALANLGISGVVFTLEHPTELIHGDFACNAALVAAKQVGKNPRTLADDIKIELEKLEIPEIDSVVIAGPGFINITLSKKFFVNLNHQIGETGNTFGKTTIHAGKKVLVEHSSPNLFKPFHIGHMMNNAIGESLVRLMQFSGAEVATMSFPSDISLGVAKAIFIFLEKKPEITIESLGDAYVEGTKRYEEDESVHARVKEIADNLYGNVDSPELSVFTTCKHFNINYFESIVGKLGSHFDSYIYESEAGIVGKDLILKNTPGIFTESQGAIVYIPDESKKGLNTAVFINSQGNPTYEAKDIGLLDLKFERVHPDLSLFVTDHEQIPHFKIVLDAAEKINKNWVDKSVHVPHGRMTFKGQKMSSRLGGVPLAVEMIEDVAIEAKARAKDPEQVKLAESIAIAAIKFAILRAKPGQNINFDPETSLSFEGDSGPYLQYTHARISSVIEKAGEQQLMPQYSEGESIVDVERMVAQFETVVANAISEYAPQYVVTYLLELARSFNSFYASNKIIDSEHVEQSQHRLAIAQNVQQVIKNGLHLLAITAPNRM
ncbi:MAG: arginine--tRNA ligase [bacterium]